MTMITEKKLTVMTSFGPVPYEAVKNYIDKEFRDLIEEAKDGIIDTYNSEWLFNKAISNISDRTGWKPNKTARFLDAVDSINPGAVFSIMLREIAIELDKQYEDHIHNCSEVYVVSMLDGRIHKVPRAHIKNFRNFAAFRTEKDAKLACKTLRNQLKDMFGNARKQKD